MRFFTESLGFLECLISLCAIIIYIFLFYLLTRTSLLHTAFRYRYFYFLRNLWIYFVYIFLEQQLEFTLSLLRFTSSFAFSKLSRRKLMYFPRLTLPRHSGFIEQLCSSGECTIYCVNHCYSLTSSYSFWLSLSFITLERAIASYFVHSYEKKFNSLHAQLLLTILFVG